MVSYQNQNIRCFIYIVYVIQLNILKEISGTTLLRQQSNAVYETTLSK